MDFVITVCDRDAGEVCPEWPGNPITAARWGIADPVAVGGSPEQRTAAFRSAFSALERRIRIFASLSFESLDRMSIKQRVDEIGKMLGDSCDKSNKE